MTREEIADKDKWVLEDLVPDQASWERYVEEVKEKIKNIPSYAGKLTSSGKKLYEYLSLTKEVEQVIDRLIVYSGERLHEDTRISANQAKYDLACNLIISYGEASAFDVPEILTLTGEKLEEFYDECEELKLYQRYLSEIFRQKQHTLSQEMEKLLAGAGEVASASSDIFSMFNNADITFGAVDTPSGDKMQLTHGTYIACLENKDRNFREKVFKQYYNSYISMKNTLAAMFSANIKQDNFFAKARKYAHEQDYALAMHLDKNNIPVSVYYSLIEAVHRHLPAMHRYMELRSKLLGLDKLHMYDLFVPVVEREDKEITFEQAKETVKKALAPMGDEYLSILQKGFDGGWIDVYENEGKRSGAYSWSAYGTHPYVLLNHQNNLDGMFTLAHEMGHAIHSYYSMGNQPYVYSEYCIFVAEVASTCNEALLTDYLLGHSIDEKEKMYVLTKQLDAFRTTVYRQTMFAEFELLAHRKVQEGEALTAESLSELYYELNKLYYGDAVVSDEEIAMEWARIPHFYTPFYVYQYATGYSAAVAFSEKIQTEGKKAVDAYVDNFLKGGNRRDPIDLLAAAGVDMSSTAPVEQALMKFEQQLKVFEQML